MAHALTLLPSSPYSSQRYFCSLCFEKGCGPVYHCFDCNFDLHVHCAAMEPLAMHFTHPQHSLNLTPPYPPPRKQTCDSCGFYIRGWSFRCNECDFDLHSVCARAPRFIVRNRFHPHPLELRIQDTHKNLKCSGCGNVLSHYAYECVRFKFRLHQMCARLEDDLKHPLHPDHSLEVNSSISSSSRLRPCHKCGREVQGLKYCCATCGIHFHPSCADVEEHHLPHNLAISDDINGRRTENSAATQTFTSHHAARHIELPGAANGIVEAPRRDDLEALKRIVQLMENMMVCRSVDSDESRGQNNSDRIAVDHCPTCLEGFDSTNPRKITSCGHSFHLPCLLEWMELSTSCPICRTEIVI